ncbi:MAG: transcription termination factor Rho [Clostridia bacterium]|nr:transcription termination factor Rho [Clostridia bacterium]
MKVLKKFDKDELKEIHLTILREIGRVIGVKAPAAKVKEKLIEHILKVQNGELKAVPPTKKGAPPKIKIDLSDYKVEASEIEYYVPHKEDRKLVLNDSGDGCFEFEGVFDHYSPTYGFVREISNDNNKGDVYVSHQNIRKYNLRSGDVIKGLAKIVKEGDSAALQSVTAIEGISPEVFANCKDFDELVPYYPTKNLRLETSDSSEDIAIRCIDLFAPLGMGQRGLIVAPPKTGKTTLLKKIAQSIEKNYKDIKLIILLIDERPEEVTDMKRSVNAEVVFSTFDESSEHHVKMAEIVINRAKRLVEAGKDVVILMDSITRLARAYNNVVEPSGRTLSGGLDPASIQGPKKFFGAARSIENGGSLTILSTALVETGSRMDDVIYEEFKGTGNMEIFLSRKLSEKRIFPAIDIYKSGTRKEELLLSEKEMNVVYSLRKLLAEREDATDSLIEMLKKTKDNSDFINKVPSWLELYRK